MVAKWTRLLAVRVRNDPWAILPTLIALFLSIVSPAYFGLPSNPVPAQTAPAPTQTVAPQPTKAAPTKAAPTKAASTKAPAAKPAATTSAPQVYAPIPVTAPHPRDQAPTPSETSLPGKRAEVSPWGVAASWGSYENPEKWARTIAEAGVTDVRGFSDDARKRSVIDSAGLETAGILKWNPPGERESFPVHDLNGWRNYVKLQLKNHPEVTHWEVWNEPPNFTQNTDPAAYATIVREAYNVTQQVAPDVKIGLATKATFIKWMADAIRAGAKGHYDYVTVHPYERAREVLDGNDEPFESTVGQVRAMLEVEDPGKASVPVRFTEVGVGIDATGDKYEFPTVSPATAASLLAKVMTLSISQGAEQVSWFDPWDGDHLMQPKKHEPPFGLVDAQGKARPALKTYERLIDALGTYPTYVGAIDLDGGMRGRAFDNGKQKVMVVWGSKANASLALPFSTTATDLVTGQQVTSSSIKVGMDPWVVAIPQAFEGTFAQKVAATTWSDARVLDEVSVTSDKNDGMTPVGEIHEVNIEGKERFWASYPEMSFSVSDKFAAWKGEPVTVTARVYVQPGNTSKVRLDYEADKPWRELDWKGMATAGGWREVKPGWQNVTWKLTDATFNGAYGMSLTLDAESGTNDKVAVDSITLKR